MSFEFDNLHLKIDEFCRTDQTHGNSSVPDLYQKSQKVNKISIFCPTISRKSTAEIKRNFIMGGVIKQPVFENHCIHTAMNKTLSQARTQITLTFLECCMQVMYLAILVRNDGGNTTKEP